MRRTNQTFWLVGLMASSPLGLMAASQVPCGSQTRLDTADQALVEKSTDGTVTFKLRTDRGTRDLTMETIADSNWRTCQLHDGSLLVLGQNKHATLYDMFRMDRKDGAILDGFWGYSPSLSPDGRWLMMRRMHAVQAGGATDDYLLYDADASASKNRSPVISRDDPKTAGVLVYPVLREEESRDNANLPDKELHSFRSDGFYWTPDSKSVAFGDFYEGKLNLILVKVEGDTPRAYSYTYRVPPGDDCLSRISPSGESMNLVNFRTSELPGGSFTVHAELRPVESGHDLCGARFADVPFSSFEAAKPEHRTVRQRKPSVSDSKQ
jgi:hypothetical protein